MGSFSDWVHTWVSRMNKALVTDRYLNVHNIITYTALHIPERGSLAEDKSPLNITYKRILASSCALTLNKTLNHC